MNKYVINGQTLTDIAESIRNKTGRPDPLTPSEMATEISGISGGGQELADSIANRTITKFSSTIESIGPYAFAQCKSLESVDLPNAINIGERGFVFCENLTNINLPVVETLGTAALSYLYNLETVVLPKVISLPSECFNGDKVLVSVDAPNALTVNSICFGSCSSLESVSLPVATLIESNAFKGCVSISLIDLPKAIKLNWAPFDGCSSLTAVILRSPTLCTINVNTTFINTPIASGTGYIYVPKSLVEEYKQATNWTTYADQIRAIEDYPEITGGAQA